MLKQKSKVKFDELTHSYWLDDKELIGVTSLMKIMGVSADYSGIDEATLAHAAELGTQAHKAIEDYINGRPVVAEKLIKSFKDLNLDPARIQTEFLVSDEKNVASSIDLLFNVDGDVYDIIDMKRNDRLHRDALAWQLGIYKYLLEKTYEVRVFNCWCLPIKKGSKDDILSDTCQPLVKIVPKSAEEVEKLIALYREGKTYQVPAKEHSIELALKEEEIADYTDAVAYLANLDLQAKEAKAIVERFNGVLYDYMLENDIDELSCPEGKVKLKRPYSTTRLDSAALKKKYPAIAEECSKTSEVKGSVSFKFNE